MDFQNSQKFNENRILMGPSEVPHRIWARSVQLLCRLLETNGQTDRQTNRQTSIVYI